VVVLAASQTLFASAKDSGNAAPGAVPPSKPDYFAAELQELDGGSVKSLGPDLGHALLIVLPAQNGPAERAGLRPGDVILALNGKPAPSLDEFNDLIMRAGSGAEVKVEIWRRGHWIVAPVRLGSASEKEQAGSIEQRIEAYNAIAKAFGKDAFPMLWARTQNNLGIAYRARVQGNRAENLEAAIKAHRAALTVFTKETAPQDWDDIERDLTITYRARAQACWENLQAAIRAYEAALAVFAGEPSPEVSTDGAAKSEAAPPEEMPQLASPPPEASRQAPTQTAEKSDAQEYGSQQGRLSPETARPRRAVRHQPISRRRARHGRIRWVRAYR
jgi:PDZ domain-containing protein